MSTLWGAGDPVEFLDDTRFAAFDDHRYLKWANPDEVPWSHESYISTSCSDDRDGDGEHGPTIIGEWSVSPPDEVQWNEEWRPDGNEDFYRRWFAAQVQSYEGRTEGWVFWTWKTQLGDYRWGYRGTFQIPPDLVTFEGRQPNRAADAVRAGVIPENIEEALSSDVC